MVNPLPSQEQYISRLAEHLAKEITSCQITAENLKGTELGKNLVILYTIIGGLDFTDVKSSK